MPGMLAALVQNESNQAEPRQIACANSKTENPGKKAQNKAGTIPSKNPDPPRFIIQLGLDEILHHHSETLVSDDSPTQIPEKFRFQTHGFLSWCETDLAAIHTYCGWTKSCTTIQKPWNDDSPVTANKQWFFMVPWVVRNGSGSLFA